MVLPFFGPAQTDAFIPALAWFLVATLLAVVPVVFAPMLGRRRRGVTVVAVVLAVLAVVPGVLQTAHAFGVLGDERATVQRTLASRYGVQVTTAEAGSLLEGGKLKSADHPPTIHLEKTAPGVYAPVQTGVGPLQPR